MRIRALLLRSIAAITPPKPVVTRYVVAPRQESLVSATKRINKHRDLEDWIARHSEAERIMVNEVQHSVWAEHPVTAKSGRVYR